MEAVLEILDRTVEGVAQNGGSRGAERSRVLRAEECSLVELATEIGEKTFKFICISKKELAKSKCQHKLQQQLEKAGC